MGGKQKVVMKIPVNDEKGRSRALKTAVGVPGCLSVAIEGADKNTIVVIGDNMDSVVLTKSLRKKVGGAELITVAPVDDKKKEPEKKSAETKPADNKKPAENIYPVVYTYHPGQLVAYAEPPPPYYTSDPCTIL
ncbi:hypothetical protein ACLOJK_032054 [Asimina triloba]